VTSERLPLTVTVTIEFIIEVDVMPASAKVANKNQLCLDGSQLVIRKK
jgi:hypothetical protein